MKIRILFFDDDKLTRKLIEAALSQNGYEVYTFSTPSKLNKNLQVRLSDNRADLIITDIRMPGLNGISWTEKLIESGFDNNNLAMISGQWEKEDIQYADDFGIMKFYKPFSVESLLKWLREAQARMQGGSLILDWDSS